MDIIRLLPDSVANQIAAGEVIQRPASVVKELVENAIDAGASEVTLLVKDAGRTLIQVIDNGKGMSLTDARFAFERHATSKIRSADDLFGLRTMGFRGEALASIAAVAQVELKTRQADSDLGTRLSIAASVVESQEAVATPVGSSFAVKNLFFNVPARRKFLKTNQTELSNVLSEFERMVLVNPTVAFKCYHNDSELHSLPSQNIKQRIASLFGKNVGGALLPVEVSTSLVEIGGFVGSPESAKKRSPLQYFFINGRYMRHPYFHRAVLYCYEGLISKEESPNYFIYLTVDPSTIDVNIHPTKTEIKFEHEQPVWQIIAAAVKEALGRYNAVPSIDFDQEGAPLIPVPSATPDRLTPPQVKIDPNYNPFNVSTSRSYSPGGGRSSSVQAGWQEIYDDFKAERERSKEAADRIGEEALPAKFFDQTDSVADVEEQELHPICFSEADILSVGYKYVAVSTQLGLTFVHKRRAHARLLFERFYQNILSRKGDTQKLIFPELIEFSAAEVAVVDEIQEELFASGFELSDLGGGTYSLLGVPSGIDEKKNDEILRKILALVCETGISVKENISQILAIGLAENLAYSDEKRLTPAESLTLVNQLFELSSPTYTADGKRILSVLPLEEIAGRF